MTIIKLDGSAAPVHRPASSSASAGASVPTVITPSSTCSLWTAGVLLWGFIIYIMTTPSHVVDRHRSAVDEKLMSMASAIKQQKSSLSQQMDEVMAKLSQQKEALLEQTGGISMPNITLPSVSLPGVVGKGHHEEEVAKLATEHKEEMEKLQDEHSQLKEHHESEVTKLQASIEQSKAELEKLKEAMGALTVDPAKFCAECPFNWNGLRTSCGARRDYLVGKHGTALEDAMEAVVKWDANCLKKDSRRRLRP